MGTDRSAVVGAVAVGAVAESDAAGDVVAGAVVVIVAGPAPDDLRDSHLDQIASTFFVVSCPKKNQSGLKSFALSES